MHFRLVWRYSGRELVLRSITLRHNNNRLPIQGVSFMKRLLLELYLFNKNFVMLLRARFNVDATLVMLRVTESLRLLVSVLNNFKLLLFFLDF
jgi:hypothetical protein